MIGYTKFSAEKGKQRQLYSWNEVKLLEGGYNNKNFILYNKHQPDLGLI